MKKAIVVRATSGIGRKVALCLLRKAWLLGMAGRREDALEEGWGHIAVISSISGTKEA
jgi:NADP-dependent 3-hydroxy acid dehydrogenase YdfG